MIYLDNAATTYPKPEEVYEAMDYANRHAAFNAGRGSYQGAREATSIIGKTKEQLRNLVKVGNDCEVVFTPSITIALNQVLQGVNLFSGDIVYLSPYEHNAVARTISLIEKNKHIIVKQLPLKEDTLEIDIEAMQYVFTKDKPRLVCCTHISNVTGYILPIKEIFSLAKKYNATTVLDTAQSLGLVPVNANLLNADIICIAGHKSLYGPFGVGGFINVGGLKLNIVIAGGTGSASLNLEMPDSNRYESSSTNIVAISGLSAALTTINQNDLYVHEKKLTDYLIESLEQIDEAIIYKSNKSNSVGVVSFNIEGYKSEDIGRILDEDFNIAVRTGYHCAPFIHQYLKDKQFNGTIRIGIGQFNSEDDILTVVEAIKDILDL